MVTRQLLIFLLSPFLFTNVRAQQKYTVLSPDKSIQVSITVTDSVRYTVSADKNEVVGNSVVCLTTDGTKTAGWKVSGNAKSSVSETLLPVVRQKSKTISNNYNQVHLDFTNGLAIEWKVFNNGVAWRWISNFQGDYKVLDEKAFLCLDKSGKSWYPQEDEYYSHNERLYKNYSMAEISSKTLASLPVLFESHGVKLLLTESGLFNYPGMWVCGLGKGDGRIQGVYPHSPKSKAITSDRDEKVTSCEDFIAKLHGPQQFPWRVLMVARHDEELIENQLVYQLAQPATDDFAWVKPGKVQWDWWNANNVYGVDFKAGVNTETYKYYIDFASKYGIAYVLLDEGWSDTQNLLQSTSQVNIQELTAYAQKKSVGILLWMSWLTLDKQLLPALDQFVQWGVKGIKVDFMQRDDQDMVNYYERVTREAAKRKLLVDFHGAFKPTGWIRTYPNLLTSEGVYGNEQSKGDREKKIGPDHNLNLPFIRNAAGPMDYTPGAMLNATYDDWKAIGNEPMSLGTRCHQLAMYVVFESPLQMLCDNPTHYYKEPECLEFLKAVPVEWDSTLVFPSKVGEYISLARKDKNGVWFLGAMTNWNAKELPLDLSFLGSGKYTLTIWKDGINAERNAKDFECESLVVDRKSSVIIKMAKGGGFVGIIKAQ